MQTTKERIHKSKWGYHPCDYATFLKLKKLNYRLLVAKRKAAAWHRWDRKATHNRKGKEPTIDEVFAVKKGKFQAVFSIDKKKRGVYIGERTPHSYWVSDGRKEITTTKDKDYKIIATNADIYAYCSTKNGGCIEIDTYGIERNYQRAKAPKPKIEDVEALDIDEKLIDELLQKIEK
jgi:hypothetical protein